MLFTDIERSTQLAQALGTDVWASVLDRHNRIVREALASHGGAEIHTAGDSFFAVFANARAAVDAAAAMQRNLIGEEWPPHATLRVRMGLHTGDARSARSAVGGDYVGFEVHRAARIAAAGHGGQVLLSETTETLVRDSLVPGLALRELGEYRLKDLARPQRIYQLVIDGLSTTFPPLRSLDLSPNNLPTQTTTFIGREDELATALRLLEGTRLLTLTGPGGTGKTRLALHLAAEAVGRFPDGVWLVELAPITNPAAVPAAVAAALHVGERPGELLLDTIRSSLRTRRLLLILDNCEHLVTACAELADALLPSSSVLKILATSREGLHVSGEQLMPVPSLRLPDGDRLPPLDELRHFEAIRLFVDRCAAFDPTFVLTARNAADVLRICRRLDGIPLALELAAARVRVLSVGEVARRLDDRFRLLTSGGRTAARRQQTLHALIDWSHELLDESERKLLRRLAVFVGGCSASAAEAVCSGDGLERDAIIDVLARLVDKSLLVKKERGGEARYFLMETIHEYAREKLVSSAEAPSLRRRHFEYFFALAENAAFFRPLSGSVAEWGIEYENLRAALEWIEGEPAGNEQALVLSASMFAAARPRGRLGELRKLLGEALARSDPNTKTLGRGRALLVAGALAGMQDDLPTARRLGGEGIELIRALGRKRELALALIPIARAALPDVAASERAMNEARKLFGELGDRWGPALMLYVMADAALERGDYGAARTGHTESLATFQSLGDLLMSSNPLLSLGRIACAEGDFARARASVEEALAIRRRPEFANPWLLAVALNSLGEVGRCEGQIARAADAFEKALVYGREIGDDGIVAWSLHNLGHTALQSGEFSVAAMRFRESLLLRWPIGPGVNVATGLAGLAGVALRDGDLVGAAQLLGAAERILGMGQAVLPPADQQTYRSDRDEIRLRLADEEFAAALEAGRNLSFDQHNEFASKIALRIARTAAEILNGEPVTR